MQFHFKRRTIAALLTAGLIAGCNDSSEEAASTPVVDTTVDAENAALKFDATNYTTINVTIDGVATKLRQYKIVYVAKPVKSATTLGISGNAQALTDPYSMQTMIVSVSDALVSDQKAPCIS